MVDHLLDSGHVPKPWDERWLRDDAGERRGGQGVSFVATAKDDSRCRARGDEPPGSARLELVDGVALLRAEDVAASHRRSAASTPRRPSTAAKELFVWIATSNRTGSGSCGTASVLGGALIPPAFTSWGEFTGVGPGGRKLTRAPRRPSAPKRPTAGRHTSGSGCRAAPSPGAHWGSAPSIAAGTAAGR